MEKEHESFVFKLKSALTDTPTPFFKNTPPFYQPLPLYEKNLNPPFLGELTKLNKPSSL